MATDDELLAELRSALHRADRQPPAERVAALRAAAADRRASTPTGPVDAPPRLAERRPSGLRRAVGLVAAAAAAAAAFTLGGAVRDRGEPPRDDLLAGGVLEFEAALLGADGATAGNATGIKTGIGRIVQVRTDDLPILPKGELYEVWFVGPGDTVGSPNRISAGTFHPDEDGRSDVDLTAAVDPAQYPRLVVTAEPGDGDPLPTGPEVVRADIVLGG